MKRMKYLLLGTLLLLLAALVWQREELPAAALARAQVGAPALPALSAAQEVPDPVEKKLASMTREEKVWQLLVLFPEQVTGMCSTADGPVWTAGLAEKPVGGLVFDGDNILSEPALREMLSAAASTGKTAPFLCVDEEGGAVARVAYALGVTTDLRPMYTYREEGGGTAYENALVLGSETGDFGFNVDFAPVADVWTNPANKVIGSRAYSDDPAEAAALVASAVRGFADSGMISVLKHFPGHGDTAEDSHDGAAVCGKTLAELEACELLPFAGGIAAGADMVMVGHITLPEIDPNAPATLSKPIVTGLLRESLGFDGVVITDAMQMQALSDYSAPEAALLALEAGCDLLLAPETPEAVAAYLLERLPEARLDESVRRILTLKLSHGLIQ